MRKRLPLITITVAVSGVLGCTTVDYPETPPVPDRVVGIEWRCQFGTNSNVVRIEESCRNLKAQGAPLFEYSKILTVRTFAGTAYTVVVDGDQAATVGDAWPP